MTKLTETASDYRTAGPDTHGMVVIHRIFRRGFPEMAALVRAVPPGDAARAEAIGPHIEFLLNGLHYHHAAEDKNIWPRLLDRAPESAHEVIARMPTDHDAVDAQMERIRGLLPAWRTNPSPDELAGALDGLAHLLVDHLDEEEREMLSLGSSGTGSTGGISRACEASRERQSIIADEGRSHLFVVPRSRFRPPMCVRDLAHRTLWRHRDLPRLPDLRSRSV